MDRFGDPTAVSVMVPLNLLSYRHYTKYIPAPNEIYKISLPEMVEKKRSSIFIYIHRHTSVMMDFAFQILIAVRVIESVFDLFHRKIVFPIDRKIKFLNNSTV